MRRKVDRAKLDDFMERLGRSAESPGVIYFTGGATALLYGFRDQTVDVDIKLDPEPKGVFESIARLKEDLDLNIELAAPDQFVPALPGWKERSVFIRRVGSVEFRHYDIYSQALSKIERGQELDLSDVQAFVDLGLIERQKLLDLFETVESELIRYPAVSGKRLRESVERFARGEQI